MRRHKSAGLPKPKVEFRADHPFPFFLRDVRSGMILFMGRVTDPTAK
jgi:serpin B